MKYTKLDSSSNGAIKALESDKKELNEKISGLTKDLNKSLKDATTLRIDMTTLRNE